ncbi:MAG: DUF2752 domain-containing protein [Sphingobacteriales bacterium]|nr:DUF2752 domain-containing protein [Sphingobacteriales bacterium]
MKKIKSYFSFELFFWITALIYLARIHPADAHFSLCVFQYLGISWCPGCGIGHSISYLLHGAIIKSVETHWLGTFALLLIVYRILQLLLFNTTKKQHYGKSILTF